MTYRLQNKVYLLFIIGCSLIFSMCTRPACTNQYNNLKVNQLTNNQLLDTVQYYAFQYFWEGADSICRAARERIHVDGVYPYHDSDIIALGGTGFGVCATIAAIDRKFVNREEGVERLHTLMDWLSKCDRFHGMWPHWADPSGKVVPFGKKDDGGDLVESSFLATGLICARQYFKDGTPREKELANKCDALWRGMEYDWYQNGKNVVYWHWSPKFAWEMNFPLVGYNECLIAYILGAASPTYPINPQSYHQGWMDGGKRVNEPNHQQYGKHLALRHNYAEQYGGPLFWAHYTYIGLDPRKLKDKYADYWQLNINHTLINREYCIDNPKNWKGYGANSWGLTSSYSIKGYSGHAPSMQNDLGVISPTAAVSSIVYTPKQSLEAMRYWYENLKDKGVWSKYGFIDAFSEHHNWFLPRYLAIDQGPMVAMIENYRSGLLWKLFMSAPEIHTGLRKLEFESW